MNLGDFLLILSNELEDDNQVRSEAEATYTHLLMQNVQLVVELHIQHLLTDGPANLKSLSLIHLHHIYKLFDFKNLVFPQEATDLVCSNLLTLFEIKEFGPNEMGNVVFIVAYIGAFYIARDIFIELPNQLLMHCKNFESPLFSSYMACLSQIIMRLPNYELQIDAEDALGIVSSCFTEGIDPIYYISAIKIIFALVTNRNVGFDERLVEQATNVAKVLIMMTGDNLYQLLSDIDVFVALYSSFFAETMDTIIDALLQVASNTEVEEQSRTRALSATTKLIQNESAACVNFLSDIIKAFLNIGCEITEDDWNIIDEDVTLSEIALERLWMLFLIPDISSQAIEITKEAVKELVQSDEWELKYTGLIAMEKIISSDPNRNAAPLDEIVAVITENMVDDNPIIQSAAAKAMSSACTMYKPVIQRTYNDMIIPIYKAAISKYGGNKTIADLICSLGKYCQECSSSLILEYTQLILETIQEFIESDDPKIQSYVVFCVNVFAAKLKKYFIEFYPTMVEWVDMILSQEVSPETRILRASAIEMVSLMGYCTDPDTFAVNADQYMKVFTSWDLDSLTFNEYEKLMAALSSIAKLVPAVFLNYIDVIFSYIYNDAIAKLIPDVHKEFSNEYHDSKETITYYYNNCVVEVNSGDNIKRVATISMLGTLLEVFGREEGFKSYIGPIKKAFGNNLFKFFYNNLVETTIGCLFKFFDILTPTSNQEEAEQLKNFGEKFISLMVKIVESTVVPTIVSCSIKHIRLAVRVLVDYDVFTSGSVVRKLLAVLPKLDEVNSQIKDKTNQEMIDEQYGAFINTWFELFPEDAAALFEEIKDVYPLNDSEPRLFAINLWVGFYIYSGCSFDDLQSRLIRDVFNGIGSNSQFVSISCFFCLAKLIEKSQFLDETINEAITIILLVTNEVTSKRVIDAGMIALAAIIMNDGESNIGEDVLSSWINNLPILTKYDDTDKCYEFFISMIENQTISITSEFLSKLISIIAKLCESKVASESTMEHFHTLVSNLRGNVEICPVFDECIEKTELEEKQVIIEFIQ